MIAGLPENGNDLAEVKKICQFLDPSASPTESFRMGLLSRRRNSNGTVKSQRLLKVCFASSYVAKSVMNEAKKLRQHPDFSGIYIRPSLPKSERDLLAKLREKQRELSAEKEQNEKYVIVGDKLLHYVNCRIDDLGAIGYGVLDKEFLFSPEELRSSQDQQQKNGM